MFTKKSRQEYSTFNRYKGKLGLEGKLNSLGNDLDWDLISMLSKLAYSAKLGFIDQTNNTNNIALLALPPALSGIKAYNQAEDLERAKDSLQELEHAIERKFRDYEPVNILNFDFNRLKHTVTSIKTAKTGIIMTGGYIIGRVAGIIFEEYQTFQHIQ